MLDFERTWWSEPGPKGAAIQARFGLSPARYYQLLAALMGSADALTYDRMLLSDLTSLRFAEAGNGVLILGPVVIHGA